MAKFLRVGNQYWSVGQGSNLQQISESDIIGRAGDLTASDYKRFGGTDPLSLIHARGDILDVSPDQLSVSPKGDLLVGGEKISLAGSQARVPNQATAQALGVSSGNLLGGQIQQDADFANYLKDTGQTYQNGRFSGTGTQRTLGTIYDPNSQPGANSGATGESKQVYRDQNDNFYVGGRKIEQPEFKNLGINADFVPRGSTLSLQQAVNGTVQGGNQSNLSQLPPEQQALYNRLDQMLSDLAKRGQVINPNVQITPEKLAEFASQAKGQIEPYYASQLKVAKDQFLGSLGFSQEQIFNQEKQYENQYRNSLRTLGTNAAEQGLAQSGGRVLNEQNLAQDIQNTIDQNRRQLQFNAGNTASQFAQNYGYGNLPTAPQFTSAPRVLPGQESFQQTGVSSPFYQLSNDVYSGLIGTQQNAQKQAEGTLARTLATDYTTQQANQQLRNLTL